jgi:predicted patatin/cPLA2 family phospholipase
MIKTILFFLLLLAFSACSSRPPAPPLSHANDLPWGAIDLDIKSDADYSIKHSLGSVLTTKAQNYSDTNSSVPFNILTLTGGGSRGAFGTGFLIGWTEKGDIPSFDIVTGISTGAVMAPFIFLGDEELEKIKYFYTQSVTEDIFANSWLHFFGYGYIMNADPLKKQFKKTFDKKFLDKIAQEHAKGRRLYIGTTNIDTGQLTVWDMGAIAASNRADKYERFCDIIYASAALPVYLPPQYIKLETKEDYYQMHIDGGIYSQVFMIGLMINWNEVLNFKPSDNTNFDVTLYTVANRKYRQRDIYQPVEQDPFGIIEAYVLTEMDLLFDRSLYRLYESCQNKGFKFKMAAIPDKMDAIVTNPTEFNPEQMVELYQLGYKLGHKGIKWKTEIKFNEYDDNKF